MSVTAQFEIQYSQYLDPSGTAVQALPAFAEKAADLIPLYRAMVLTRRFDAKAVALQRTGRMGTYPSSLGQEAVTVGLAAAMEAQDVLLPSYRETGAMLWRGVSLEEILTYWGGDERGSDFAGPREDFPISVPVCSQTLHAVGVAYAMKLRRQPRVAVVALGDGATSKGDFYEAINIAGAWQVPAVFVVNNNQWAISVPREKQSAAETLAQKAIAAGIPGEQVDGNDAIAVRHAVGQAIERARDENTPGLVEALTYRMTDHTTADAAGRYRDEDVVSEQWKLDPVARLRTFLADAGAWEKSDEERLIEETDRTIDAAVEAYESLPRRSPESIFDHLYAELPAAFAEQRTSLAKATSEGGSTDA